MANEPRFSADQAENARADEAEASSNGTNSNTPEHLQDSLRKAEQQAQEHHDAWLRAKAEADNVRKRAQADIANAHKYALENFSNALLPVRDSLEAGLAVDRST
ncbi:MAG: nucleotide exchange factor GrpE, partial [Betaproteobacteria bacterium]